MLEIDIVETNIIEGGVEVFARAWRDGVQIGFGPDGSVDVERHQILNPPVLVSDPVGTITREYIDEHTGAVITKHYREDPEEAMLTVIERAINKTVTFDDSNIEAGKYGSTITTLYPSAGTTAPVDGLVLNSGSGYTTIRNAASGNSVNNTATEQSIATHWKDGATFYIRRGMFGFDIASIGSDEISAATFTIYGNGSAKTDTDSDTIDVVSATPASDSALATGDYDQVGTTVYATLAMSSYVTTDGTANDWTIDAAGITYIEGWSTIGFLGVRLNDDTTGTAPTGGNDVVGYNADEAGTTNDPTLVLTHAAASSTNIKSIAGVTQANIKSIAGVAIASIKSIAGVTNT